VSPSSAFEVPSEPRHAIVVPLKHFDAAKGRLRLGGIEEVSALARRLAEGVVRSCAPRHVIVLTESDEVSAFATELGAEVLVSDATDLNEAVQHAYEALSERYDHLVVVHGDLRCPDGLGQFDPGPGVTIVADHHGTGTNVLAVPTGVGFRFAYGADSAPRHRREAQRLGLDWRLIADSPWRFDVDEPDDLD
jgi:2-phospho-L-lactate guanylyltransferase